MAGERGKGEPKKQKPAKTGERIKKNRTAEKSDGTHQRKLPGGKTRSHKKTSTNGGEKNLPEDLTSPKGEKAHDQKPETLKGRKKSWAKTVWGEERPHSTHWTDRRKTKTTSTTV